MKYHAFLRRIAAIILVIFLPICAMAAEKVEYRVPDLQRYADLSMGAKHREMDNYFSYSYNGDRSDTLDMMEDFAQLLINEYGFICCGSEFLGQDEEAKVIWLEHFDPAIESFSLSKKEAGTKIDECDICLNYEKKGNLYEVVFLTTKNLVLTDMGERSASLQRSGVVSIGDLRVGEYRNYDKLLPISEQEKTADHSSSGFGSGNLGFNIDFDEIGKDSGFGYGDFGFNIDFDEIGKDSGFGYGDFGFDIDFDAIIRDSGFGDGRFDIDFDPAVKGQTTNKPRDCGLCKAGNCRNCKGMGYTINPYTGDKIPCDKFCPACNGEGIIY